MENKERKQQEQLVNEAKAYFDARGLSTSLDVFFAREDIKLLIHEKYAAFVENVNEIVSEAEAAELPEVILERTRSVAEAITEEDGEGKYADDVKLSVMCSMYNLLQGLEAFINVDDAIIAPFKVAFENAGDGTKFMESFNEICDGVISKMIEKTVKLICVPRGLPEDIMDILMMIGGGMPMMNLEEMESMFGRGGDDDKSDSEED